MPRLFVRTAGIGLLVFKRVTSMATRAKIHEVILPEWDHESEMIRLSLSKPRWLARAA